MSSKQKNKNHNRKKGKPSQKVQRRFVPKIIKKVRGGDFVFVALDTNILFNFIDIFLGKGNFKSLKEYNAKLAAARFMNDKNIYNKQGYLNPNGKIAFVVLPNVLKEALTNKKYSSHRPEIKKLIENRMLTLSFDAFKESEIALKVNPLLKELQKQGFFMKDGKPMQDLFNFAEAQVLNLTLLTEDSDFGVDSKDKISKLKAICQRKLQGDHNGFMEYPMKMQDFMQQFEQGRKFSCIQNVNLLDKESQEAVSGKFPPNKHLQKQKEKELV